MATGVSGSSSLSVSSNSGGGELLKAVVVNESTGEIEYIEDYVEIPDNSGVSHEVEVVTVDDFRRRLHRQQTLQNPNTNPNANSTSTTQSIVKPLLSTLSSPPPPLSGGGSSSPGFRNTPSLLRNSRAAASAAARNLNQNLQIPSSAGTVPVPPVSVQQIQIQSHQQQLNQNQIQIQQQLHLQQAQQQSQQAIQQIFEFLPGLNSIQLTTSPSVLPPASAQFLRTFEHGNANITSVGLDSSGLNQLIVYNCGDNQYELLPGQEGLLDGSSGGNVQLRLCEVIQTEGGDHEIVEGISVIGEDGSTQFQTSDGNTIYICSDAGDGMDEMGDGDNQHQTFTVPIDVDLEDGEELQYEGIQIVDQDGMGNVNLMPILQDEDGNIYEVQGGHEGLEMEFPVPMPIPAKRRKKMGGSAKVLGASAAARLIAGKPGDKSGSLSLSPASSLKVAKKPLNELKCLETGCPFAAVNVAELRKHLCTIHFFTFDEEVIMFQSDKDFKSWRETYERERMVSFIFRGGTKKISRDQAVTYLICHRSGHYKPTMKDQSLRKRKMKPQGSCKMNGYCTAGIKLLKNLETGEVRCEICHTHYGHPLDNGAIPHLRVNNVLRKIIRKKFEEGMSFNQVVQYLHHNPDHLEGLRLLDRRAVRNIYDKFRKNPKEFFDEDSNDILDHENEDVKSPGSYPPIEHASSPDHQGDTSKGDSTRPKSPFILRIYNEPSTSEDQTPNQQTDVKPPAGSLKIEPAQQQVTQKPSDTPQEECDKDEEPTLITADLDDSAPESQSPSVSISTSTEVNQEITPPQESELKPKEIEKKITVKEAGPRKLRSRSRSTVEIEVIAAEDTEASKNKSTTIIEIPAPASPKKRGRKPKTTPAPIAPKLTPPEINSPCQSESDRESATDASSHPRRSGRERKPKLFHDDQEDIRFQNVRVKVEPSTPEKSQGNEKEPESSTEMPPPSLTLQKGKETPTKSQPPKIKAQPSSSVSNQQPTASHHLVPLTLDPPTLEQIENIPTKGQNVKLSNSVPSPAGSSASTSSESSDIPPPILQKEKPVSNNDEEQPPPSTEQPGDKDKATPETEGPGASDPAAVPAPGTPSIKAGTSTSASAVGPKSQKKNIIQSQKDVKVKVARSKPKPKVIKTESDGSGSTSTSKKVKESAPPAPQPETISPELKATINGMLKHGESGPTVLLYKNPGTLTPEYGRKDSRLHKEDFVLIIQTPVQRQLMQMFSDVINIDGHRGRPKDLKLMWVIVLDEFREAIPVAWLITNNPDYRMFSIFFRVLHSSCGDIQTNFIMAPKSTGNEYCNLWASVFKPTNPKTGSTSNLPKLILNEEETKRDMRIEVAETFPDTVSRRTLNTCMNQFMWAVSEKHFQQAYEDMKDFLETKHGEKGETFFRNYEMNWISRSHEWDLLHRIASPVNTLYSSDSFGKLKKFIAFKGTRILNSCIDPVLKIGYDKCFSRSKRIFKGDQKLLRSMEDIEMQHGWGSEIDPDNFVLIKNEDWTENTENSANAEDSEYLKFRFCVKDPEKNTEYFVFNTQSPCRCKYVCSKCEICVHQFICTCPLSVVEHQMCSHIHFVQIMTQIRESQRNSFDLNALATTSNIGLSLPEYHMEIEDDHVGDHGTTDTDAEGVDADGLKVTEDEEIPTVDLSDSESVKDDMETECDQQVVHLDRESVIIIREEQQQV